MQYTKGTIDRVFVLKFEDNEMLLDALALAAFSQGGQGHTLISDLIISNRLLISSSLDIFDFIIVTRRLMEE